MDINNNVLKMFAFACSGNKQFFVENMHIFYPRPETRTDHGVESSYVDSTAVKYL